MRSLVGRLGLRRLWRNRVGRRLYRLLQRLGVVVSLMVRYEAGPATGERPDASPAAFSTERWSADDPAVPEGVPGSLEPTDVVVGATLDGDLVGYCVLSPRPVLVAEIGDVVDPRGLYLWDLYVDPAYRGRGLGTALLWRARRDAAAAEYGTVEALVAADNEPSRRAFAAAGFAPTERLFSVGWGEHTYRRRRSLADAADQQ